MLFLCVLMIPWIKKKRTSASAVNLPRMRGHREWGTLSALYTERLISTDGLTDYY